MTKIKKLCDFQKIKCVQNGKKSLNKNHVTTKKTLKKDKTQKLGQNVKGKQNHKIKLTEKQKLNSLLVIVLGCGLKRKNYNYY